MLVLRPCRESDIDTLYDLSLGIGWGFTSLPPDREVLARRVRKSVDSFAADIREPGEEYYLFVCEDGESGRIVGTSGIFATVGLSRPFYSYRLLHLTQVSHDPDMKVDTELLQLVNDFAGATEIGTLYLHPDYRQGRNGALLSKARYLLMAAEPQRFAGRVMAEIRGWIDEAGYSPFWEAIGRHFFNMDFGEADRINARGNSQFIADLMPKFPIYKNLLPRAAQDVIGRPHAQARGAVRLLEGEGYRFAGAVDIFDGGPCYDVPRDVIRTVRKARAVRLKATGGVDPAAEEWMLARPVMADFRILRAPLRWHDEETISIDDGAARALGVTPGETLLAAPLKGKGGGS